MCFQTDRLLFHPGLVQEDKSWLSWSDFPFCFKNMPSYFKCVFHQIFDCLSKFVSWYHVLLFWSIFFLLIHGQGECRVGRKDRGNVVWCHVVRFLTCHHCVPFCMRCTPFPNIVIGRVFLTIHHCSIYQVPSHMFVCVMHVHNICIWYLCEILSLVYGVVWSCVSRIDQ